MKNFQNKTKIIKVSKFLRSLLRVGLFLWVFSVLGLLTSFLIPIFVLPSGQRHLQADSGKIYFECGNVAYAAFGFIVNLKLFQFFDRLQCGHLFDAQTVANLDVAGKWWVVLWLFQGLFDQIGTEYFGAKGGWDVTGIAAGLTLIFVAWLLKEAQELQEEQELTV